MKFFIKYSNFYPSNKFQPALFVQHNNFSCNFLSISELPEKIFFVHDFYKINPLLFIFLIFVPITEIFF